MAHPRPKYNNTQCRVMHAPDMSMWYDEKTLLTSWKAKFIDKTFCKPNFSDEYDKIKKVPGFKYFLVDFPDLARLDIEWAQCGSEAEKDRKTIELMSTVTKFTENFEKVIILRSMPPAVDGSTDPHTMFPDEILEMIPILMKQQSTPISDNDERLEKYRDLWKQEVPHLYKTIEVPEFLKILEEFDINKKKVTIAQDPGQELARIRQIKTGVDEKKVFTPDMKIVVDTSQALFMVVQGLICGVHWKTEQPENLKARIYALIKEFKNLEKRTFITLQYVLTAILKLKQEFQPVYVKKFDYDLKDHTAEGLLHLRNYLEICGNFELILYNNFLPRAEDDPYLPVWMVRVFLKYAWIKQFFEEVTDDDDDDDEKNELRELVFNTVMFLAPEMWKKKAERFLKSPRQTIKPVPTTEQVIEGFEKLLGAEMAKKNGAKK